jgi:AraC family ethanolamine operon transcriptional activator
MAANAANSGYFRSLSYEFNNFEEFNASIRGWSTEFRQIERGVATVKLRHRMTPLVNALDVDFTHSTASKGTTQPGHRTFGMVGHDVFPCQILRFDAHEDFFTFTPSAFVGRTLSIEENLLSEIAENLGFHEFLDVLDGSKDVLEFAPLAIRRFRSLYDRPMYRETDLIEVAEGIVILVGSSCDVYDEPWQRNSSQLLDKALEYIAANAYDAITVADVCKSLGVGYRRLDRAFKHHLGQGPKDSILACRLNGVRAELRASDPSRRVSDIANAWGFWHMGDFARIYRNDFGELPSTTLSRSRR